jgi:hypothetical protein
MAATLTTYMQSLDRHHLPSPVQEDLFLSHHNIAATSCDGSKLRGYLERARQMARETRMFKEMEEKDL